MGGEPRFVGIDVSKAQSDGAVRPTGKRWVLPYDETGTDTKTMNEVSLSQLVHDLDKFGFHIFDWFVDAPIESLANTLGHPVASTPGRPIVDLLVPKPDLESLPGTLSSIHGTGAFPFHSETAHWRRPVDLVVLKCVNPGAGDRPTLLIDGLTIGWGDCEITLFERSLMLVKNGSKSFYAPLAKREKGRVVFRYDRACMKPSSNADKLPLDIFERAIAGATRIVVAWKAGRCVVFDNRRLLHSRAESPILDSDRQIERLYIVEERQ